MTRITRPGVPVPAYRSGVPGPRPGYRPPVSHSHGSRRQATYDAVDSRTAITESMEAEPLADWERELLHGGDSEEGRQANWITSAVRRERAESDRALRALRVRLGVEDPIKPRKWHVTKDHRVPIFEIAKRIGLTSAQTLVLVNGHFHEWAPNASSTVATIVADQIESWCSTDEAVSILSAIREA